LRAGHLWQKMPQPKASEVMWMAESAPWQVICERDSLSARRALRTGKSVCLAHQREAVEATTGGSLVTCDADAMAWNLPQSAFKERKLKWKQALKPRFVSRVCQIKKGMVSTSKHDAKYGRGSVAVADATRVGQPGVEMLYWSKVLSSAVNRQALVRFKLGMIPGAKSTLYKWGGQLARFSLDDARRLMACGCGGGPELAPQDPYHVAFECSKVKPFWEDAVAAMDACTVKGLAVDAAVWASFSFEQKCKWGLVAADGLFEPSLARDMHECMAAAVAKLMAGALDVFKDVPSLRSLALPYVCLPAPTVMQGLPVTMTGPPPRCVPDLGVVRVPVWPREACLSVPWRRGGGVDPR
jgi:hypothetical protein